MVDVNALRSKLEADFVGEAGRAFYEEYRERLEKLPPGSYVVIAVETGEFVTGSSLGDATTKFEKKLGDVLAYVRRIGRLTRF